MKDQSPRQVVDIKTEPQGPETQDKILLNKRGPIRVSFRGRRTSMEYRYTIESKYNLEQGSVGTTLKTLYRVPFGAGRVLRHSDEVGLWGRESEGEGR